MQVYQDILRYKIIVQVTIGQMRDQGVRITSRSLWDTTTDNYATVSYQNQNIWASAMSLDCIPIESGQLVEYFLALKWQKIQSKLCF